MSRKKTRISYKKERCLLSEVLPYEIPLSFSNRHFYKFILRHRVAKDGNSFVWLKSTPALDNIVHLLLCLPENSDRISDKTQYVGENPMNFRQYSLDNKKRFSKFVKPFTFKINHKENEFRELCIPHPQSQILMADFYDRCKETILYYTSLSPFSIRTPSKVSKFTYHKDRLHSDRKEEDETTIETADKEYERLKSFFVYKKYSNIYKFYESNLYHYAEKKYNKLIKLDISKCFDSIYTHSIGWAVFGKETQKENLDNKHAKTFPDQFDELMRHMNRGETNGIIIGPEFSRIFAEIILQSIDREVALKLQKGKNPLYNQIDYEIYRYVDDYFIFYNNEIDKNIIVDELQHTLKEYKLHLNSAKAVIYRKPIITETTMAKHQIAKLLEDKIKFSLEKIQQDDDAIIKGSISVNSKHLITSFKTIIKQCNVEYNDILNYSLSIVERKCKKIVEEYSKITPEHCSNTQLTNSIIAILEFSFFIYSVSPRVNTTIRLCRILRVIMSFFQTDLITKDQSQRIQKHIYDNVCFILKKNENKEQTQIETLYLLTTLSEMGKDYWLEEKVLEKYLRLEDNKKSNMNSTVQLNYFSITVSLLYMKNKVRYNKLRSRIVDISIERIRKQAKTCRKDAELILLLFDMISCPYVADERKIEALEIFGVDVKSANDIIKYRDKVDKPQVWFTNWLDFDFDTELDAKRSQEVY